MVTPDGLRAVLPCFLGPSPGKLAKFLSDELHIRV